MRERRSTIGELAHRTGVATSALAALSADEKAAVLDELLAARSDLRQLAETHAAQLMSAAARTAVAAVNLPGTELLDLLTGWEGIIAGRGGA